MKPRSPRLGERPERTGEQTRTVYDSSMGVSSNGDKTASLVSTRVNVVTYTYTQKQRERRLHGAQQHTAESSQSPSRAASDQHACISNSAGIGLRVFYCHRRTRAFVSVTRDLQTTAPSFAYTTVTKQLYTSSCLSFVNKSGRVQCSKTSRNCD